MLAPVALALLGASVGLAIPVTTTNVSKSIDWHSCGLSNAPTARCAVVWAPLNYENLTDPRTVNLAVLKVPASAPVKERLGTIYLNFGGPGASGVNTLPAFASVFSTVLGGQSSAHVGPTTSHAEQASMTWSPTTRAAWEALARTSGASVGRSVPLVSKRLTSVTQTRCTNRNRSSRRPVLPSRRSTFPRPPAPFPTSTTTFSARSATASSLSRPSGSGALAETGTMRRTRVRNTWSRCVSSPGEGSI